MLTPEYNDGLKLDYPLWPEPSPFAPIFQALMRGPEKRNANDAGDVADLMGNTPAGVRSGGCTWTNGPYGPCLSFDGSSGACSFGKAASLALPASMSFALTITVLTWTSSRFLFADFDSTGIYSQGSLSFGPSNSFGYYHYASGSSFSFVGAGGGTTGTPYRVCVTRNDVTKNLQIYVNGAPSGGPGTYPGSIASQSSCGNRKLGQAGDYPSYSNVLFHGVSVWPGVVLTPSQVALDACDPLWWMDWAPGRVILSGAAAAGDPPGPPSSWKRPRWFPGLRRR